MPKRTDISSIPPSPPSGGEGKLRVAKQGEGGRVGGWLRVLNGSRGRFGASSRSLRFALPPSPWRRFAPPVPLPLKGARYVESFAQNSDALAINAVPLLLKRSNSQTYNKKHSNRADNFAARDSICDAFNEVPARPSDNGKKYRNDEIYDHFSSDRVCFDPFSKFLTSDFAIRHLEPVSSRNLKNN